MMDISSRSRLSDIALTTSPRYLQKAALTSSGSSSRLEWISCSFPRFDAASTRATLLALLCHCTSHDGFWRPSATLPKGSRPFSASLPGLWCAMNKLWASCKPWEETNTECQVSISLRWDGTSGLKVITTPLQSFMSAGQHDSNLHWKKKKILLILQDGKNEDGIY